MWACSRGNSGMSGDVGKHHQRMRDIIHKETKKTASALQPDLTLRRTTMKTFIIGSLAALVATVSLASAAEAGWKHKHGHHHGWHKRHHWGVVVVSPRYYGDYCFVKKIKRYDDWGNVYIKRVRICD